MWLLEFIKSLFNKPKYDYTIEEGMIPYNTIIDSRFLILDSNNKDERLFIFKKIEEFYKENNDVIVVRHFYYDHALVVVHPESFDNGILTLQAAEGLSAGIFIGRHGKDIDHFKSRLNSKVYERYGFYNPIKTINIKTIKC